MNSERSKLIHLVQEAREYGARQSKACDVIGISAKTFQRWSQVDNNGDNRLYNQCVPHNKLSELERQRLIKVANDPDYADLQPSKIVPKLADSGCYIASESTFYRVLSNENQLMHRQKSKPVRQQQKPKPLIAIRPNQIYSWDITYLPTPIRGVFLYLYLVLDIYSRKIVGWQVHDCEVGALAADMMTDICHREGVKRNQVTLHSDNGSPMRGATMLATLQELGVVPSFSRPSVSNDNPYSESLFRTLKYRPEYPAQSFADLSSAREWVAGFTQWYNNEHLHSAIRFVTPSQRHSGDDIAILSKRQEVYKNARQRNPERWSGDIRNWEPITEVYLNPEKQKSKVNKNKAA